MSCLIHRDYFIFKQTDLIHDDFSIFLGLAHVSHKHTLWVTFSSQRLQTFLKILFTLFHV